MKVLDGVKLAVGMTASYGAGMIIDDIVEETTPMDESNFRKVVKTVGKFAIAGVVGAFAMNYMVELIDVVALAFNKKA